MTVINEYVFNDSKFMKKKKKNKTDRTERKNRQFNNNNWRF